LVEGIIHTLPSWRHPILAVKMAAAILFDGKCPGSHVHADVFGFKNSTS
jgi:hypothetical protein